jgi:integrase
MPADQPLLDDVEAMIAERDICPLTAEQYRRSVRGYSTYLGEPARRAHLLEREINRWLAALGELKASQTVRGYKAGITAVWNWLSEQHDWPAYNPNRLRRIKRIAKPPVAWALSDVRKLLDAAQHVEGRLSCGRLASEVLTAWIWVGYESGLRRSDVLRLEVDQIADCVSVVQHKTNNPHTFRLSDTALAAVRQILIPGRNAVFGISPSAARRIEEKLFAEAKRYGFQRRPRQGLGTLRKTHGTEVCRANGLAAAAQSLGHISGTMTARQSYVAPDAIASPPPPPRLIDDERRDNRAGPRAPRRGDGGESGRSPRRRSA